MQEVLLGDSAPHLTGGWRSEQVWIGGDSLGPHRAAFVPPHHDRVPEAMRDLVAFVARTDIPSFAHAALAHAQFETVHPFPDGNGRTGRALVQSMLRHQRVTTRVTVPVSAGLLHDVDGYYRALTAFRAGDIEPILRVFATAAFYAVGNGRELTEAIRAIEAEWGERMRGLRSDAAARRIARLALAHPVVDYRLVVDELAVAPVTAYRALDTLVERGVLRVANSRERNRIWLAAPVLAALDSFAARAGRRRVPAE